MQEVLLDYGDRKMSIELPDSATVVRYGETYSDPPERWTIPIAPVRPWQRPWACRR